MQFFPDLSFEGIQATTPKAGNPFSNSRNALDKAGSGLNFAAMLSESSELNNSGLAPFNDALTPGIAKGFASIKDDTGKLKTRDLNFLESRLRDGGVDENVLQGFMSGLFSGAELPTVGKIMGAARNQGRSGEALNDQEKIAFSSMMQRIGFNTEEIAQMEELSYQGKGLNVLKSIEARLQGQMGQASQAGQAGQTGTTGKDGVESTLLTDTLHMTKEELNALSKIFNLSEKSTSALLEKFGDNAEINLSGKDFSKLFASAKAELSNEEGQMNKLRSMTPEIIRDMLNNAKLAASQEANVDNRGSRKLERQEIIMRDGATALKDEDEEDDKYGSSAIRRKSILTELSAKADKNETERGVAEAMRDSHNRNGSVSERMTDDRLTDERGSNARGNSREERREFSDALKQDAEKASLKAENGSASGREILSSKLENLTGASFAQTAQQAQSGNQPGSSASLADSRAAQHQERIFEQVEQGIIRNAADGSKQITMRLDPPDLGRLTLTLTVNNGEVKALIRTEQTEVTRVVSEQLAALKTSLEEQGFKVAGLDVETRPENHTDMQNWSSAEQHNKEQELASQANFLRLARTRASEGETLARNMQNIPQQAQIAESGLHIVA
ncbi:flagellar hook-length control protein FliK [Desulfovibrio sp. OttesenSCG-928-C06]|nr:flagellar hook-length control protein FliK [Desulfovibrio sp. OttesenSCG-928-C06]